MGMGWGWCGLEMMSNDYGWMIVSVAFLLEVYAESKRGAIHATW